jgi:polar amino acid transport system substrate-binding protein
MMKAVFAGLIVAVGCIGVAHAARLDDIRARGALVCGVFGDLVPLGFEDPKTRTLVGFDVDVCKGVADSLHVKLELKTLSVAARVPSLQTDRVDVVAAAMGYTSERAKQIAFSAAYIQVPIPVLVLSDSGIEGLNDLRGKKVSAIRGSTPELFARQKLPESEIVTFDDGPLAYLALQQHKVQAMAISQGAGIGFRNPSEGKVRFLAEVLHWEPDCIGIKLGETALLDAVNAGLGEMEKSGQLQTIWDKWFGDGTEYKLTREKKLTPLAEFENQP